MYLRRLPAEEAAVRRYAEELWLPCHRELEATVERHVLPDRANVDRPLGDVIARVLLVEE
jgi:hypothetical protein